MGCASSRLGMQAANLSKTRTNMIQPRRVFLLSACALLLAACATPNIPADYSLDKAVKSGVAAGSITYEGGHASYRLHIVSKTSDTDYLVEHGSAQTLNLKLAFKGEAINPALQKRGSTFAVELPAGGYIIKSWHISQGAANVTSTAPTGIEFEVEAGKAIYLGNFHFKETSRLGRAVTGSQLTLSDQSTRDLPAVRSAFPNLASTPFSQSLATGTVIEHVGGESNGQIAIPIFIPMGK